MPITKSGKNWQDRNRDKARQYSAKYSANRKKVTIYLEDWVTEEIDQVKEPGQTYGNWVRLQIEQWAKLRAKSSRNI